MKDFEIINITFKLPNLDTYNTTIHLSQTIQNYLETRGSKIKLDIPNDGKLPIGYAYIFKEIGRSFSADKSFDIDSETEELDFYTIYLRIDKYYYGRAKIFELEKIANLIYDWMEEAMKIELLQKRYSEIEIFQPITGLSKEKSEVWNRIKNFFFSHSSFDQSRNKKWIEQYEEMLEILSKSKKLEKFIPFTSHFRLHLNNKDKSLPWHYIYPYEDGKYGVTKQIGIRALSGEKPEIDETFDSIDEAIDYYAELLKRLELNHKKE